MKKKINVDREKISAEEIASQKNFDQLLSQFPGFAKPPLYKSGWFITTVASVAAVVTVTTMMLNNESEEVATTEEQTDAPPLISDLDQDIITYDEDTPCVNPPVEHLDVKQTSYLVGSEGGSFEHKTGSTIEIPASAFVDEDGKTVEGEVEIKYREFHDPVDFLVSGIPMNYDSAGTNYTFESAGMVEIYGEKDGKPVEIAEGKKIKISLLPKDGSDRFNLYELDTSNGKWGYKGKPTLVQEDVEEGDHGNDLAHDWTMNPNEIVIPNEIRTAYIKADKAKASAEGQLKKATDAVIAYKKKEPETPKKPVDNDRIFELDVDPSEFPELSGFGAKMNFEVAADDRNFSMSIYDASNNWNNIVLTQGKVGADYNMTLFKKGGKKTLRVHPVYEGANYAKAMAQFDRKFDKYKKELKEKQKEEARLKKSYEEKLATWQAAKAAEAKAIAEMKEKQMAQLKVQMENDQVKRTISRAFEIDKFGTWNCDSPVPQPSGMKLEATYEDKDGNKLEFQQLNLIEKGRNALFLLIGAKIKKLITNPKERNYLVGFSTDKKLAIAYPESFIDAKGQRKYTFKMEVLDVDVLDLAAVKKKLGFTNA